MRGTWPNTLAYQLGNRGYISRFYYIRTRHSIIVRSGPSCSKRSWIYTLQKILVESIYDRFGSTTFGFFRLFLTVSLQRRITRRAP